MRWWVPEEAYNVYHYRKTDRELYDLVQDPGETQNLAGQLPDVEAELNRLLWDWIEASYHEGRGREITRGRIEPEIEEALRALGYVE